MLRSSSPTSDLPENFETRRLRRYRRGAPLVVDGVTIEASNWDGLAGTSDHL